MSSPVVRFVTPEDADAARVLDNLQQTLLRHPLAAQAAFAWLAAEGRRFARTEAGAIWRERLAASELIAQLRLVWDSVGMTAFNEKSDELLPEFFLDGLVSAASAENIESLLVQLLAKRM